MLWSKPHSCGGRRPVPWCGRSIKEVRKSQLPTTNSQLPNPNVKVGIWDIDFSQSASAAPVPPPARPLPSPETPSSDDLVPDRWEHHAAEAPLKWSDRS